MSMSRMEKIVCSECGKESEFRVWESINTVLDPELKEKVRNRDVFTFICPHCGEITMVNYACLYHQMEDKIMIYYVPGDIEEAVLMMQGKYRNDMGEVLDLSFNDLLAEGYVNRVVHTMNEFVEKLAILDAGLDDRFIEIMKVLMIFYLMDKDEEFSCEEFLFDNTGEALQFVISFEDGEWATTNFSKDLYEHIVEEFNKNVEDDEVVINRQWALSKIE